jgi:hypothetical protein
MPYSAEPYFVTEYLREYESIFETTLARESVDSGVLFSKNDSVPLTGWVLRRFTVKQHQLRLNGCNKDALSELLYALSELLYALSELLYDLSELLWRYMRIPYSQVQGSGYNACTGKYCIICPGGTKKKYKRNKKKIKKDYQ